MNLDRMKSLTLKGNGQHFPLGETIDLLWPEDNGFLHELPISLTSTVPNLERYVILASTLTIYKFLQYKLQNTCLMLSLTSLLYLRCSFKWFFTCVWGYTLILGNDEGRVLHSQKSCWFSRKTPLLFYSNKKHKSFIWNNVQVLPIFQTDKYIFLKTAISVKVKCPFWPLFSLIQKAKGYYLAASQLVVA